MEKVTFEYKANEIRREWIIDFKLMKADYKVYEFDDALYSVDRFNVIIDEKKFKVSCYECERFDIKGSFFFIQNGEINRQKIKELFEIESPEDEKERFAFHDMIKDLEQEMLPHIHPYLFQTDIDIAYTNYRRSNRKTHD